MHKCREIFTNPGDKMKTVYSPKVLANGEIEIVETGKEDLQEFYNCQAEGTDIKSIQRKLANGDFSCLNQFTPFYGDFTKTPKTLAEYMQVQADCSTLFSMLPAEIREKYDNSVNKFTANAGEKEWLETCLPYFSEEAKAYYMPKDEVKE